MKTPEEIYLIPSTDADYSHEWCECPAPTDSHNASESVRYVRADVVTDRVDDAIQRLSVNLTGYMPAKSVTIRLAAVSLIKQLHQQSKEAS